VFYYIDQPVENESYDTGSGIACNGHLSGGVGDNISGVDLTIKIKKGGVTYDSINVTTDASGDWGGQESVLEPNPAWPCGTLDIEIWEGSSGPKTLGTGTATARHVTGVNSGCGG